MLNDFPTGSHVSDMSDSNLILLMIRKGLATCPKPSTSLNDRAGISPQKKLTQKAVRTLNISSWLARGPCPHGQEELYWTEQGQAMGASGSPQHRLVGHQLELTASLPNSAFSPLETWDQLWILHKGNWQIL